jgi:two-component system, OmpR family, response regulator QseB
MTRVLLVEDDAMIGASLQKGLAREHYTVDWVRDAPAAEAALDLAPYAAVLLDLGLPRGDGLTLLARMRAQRDATPVLVITARDSLSDRVRGLDGGADDYLVKPFEFEELSARLRALLRRAAGRAADPVLACGPVLLDPRTRVVTCRGVPVALSPKEFKLLAALLDQPGTVLSRAQLEARLYGWDEPIGSNAVEVHLHHLRAKLGEGVIVNVRGQGYRVAPDPLAGRDPR